MTDNPLPLQIITDHEIVKKIQSQIIEYMIINHNVVWITDDYERELYTLIFNTLASLDIYHYQKPSEGQSCWSWFISLWKQFFKKSKTI